MTTATSQQVSEVLAEHPELLDDPGLKRIIAKAEAKELEESLAPVISGIEGVLSKHYSGLPEKAQEAVGRLRIGVEVDDKGKVSFPISVGRASTSSGASGQITSRTYKELGFVAFVVGDDTFDKPIPAIEAAGGEKAKTSENHWRVILTNGYVNLPIAVRVKAGNKTEDLSLADFATKAKAAA